MKEFTFEVGVEPRPFSYRAGIKNVGRGKVPIVMPSKEYAKTKQAVIELLAWLPKKLNEDFPGHVIAGISQLHTFEYVKSTTQKRHAHLLSLHRNTQVPTTVAKGDVHDNLNKLLPDALTDLGIVGSDARIMFSLSVKARDHNARVEVTLFLLPKEIMDEYTIE